MNESRTSTPPALTPGRVQAYLLTAILVVGIVFLLLQVLQTWNVLRSDSSRFGRLTTLTRGALCSVLLVNGRMYYGSLVEAGNGFIRLKDVYYVRAVSGGSGAASNNELVNSRIADWDGPEWLVIPQDKVIMLEKVGANSQVAKLIAEDRKVHGG
ncbi:MAG: hypothetical protein ACYDHM_14060 [Acidiferrobacterales bacterium]